MHSSSKRAPQLDQLAIKCLLYVLMSSSTQWVNERWHYLDAIVDYHDPSGRRVWWRIPMPPTFTNFAGDSEFAYFNVTPGEFTKKLPTDPDDVIRDFPTESGSITLIEHLKRFIQIVDRKDSEYKHLLQHAENALAASQVQTKYNTLKNFWTEAQQLGLDKSLSTEQINEQLYKNYFENFRLEGMLFSPAMLMVNIELSSGQWLPGQAFVDSIGALSIYLRWLPHEYPVIPDVAVQLGNSHFEEGKRRFDEARSALTLDSFYDNLYIAAHHFYTAFWALHLTTKWVDPSKFRFDERTVDEKYAISATGLSAELEDFIAGRRPQLEEMLVELLREDRESDARERIRNLTSPTNTIYPKYFAQVSLAIAMITIGGKWLNQGIESLRSLEDEFNKRATLAEMASFELDRILYKLAIGYQKSGDNEQADRYTAKFGGRQLVRNALKGWH